MKHLLTLILIIVAFASSAQVAQYNKTNKKGYYTQYITQNADTLNVGDKLNIGSGTTEHGYAHITQANKQAAHHLAGKTITIDKFKAVGNKKIGYTVYVAFKGYGLPVYIDYENALKTGEIINNK